MASKKWSDLSAPARAAIISIGVVDAAGRVAALVDLARRPQSRVRGKKAIWATGLAIVSSSGILPAVYFARGRK